MGLKITICGGTGFIGAALQDYYRKKGLDVSLITRKALHNWEELDALTGDSSMLINVAGEPVIGWWTKKKRERIRNSRIGVTRLLVDSLNRVAQPPELFIQASAIGIYRENSTEIFDEESRNHSTSFLGEVVEEWENALTDLKTMHIRPVIMRIGLVLGSKGGFLHKLIPWFRYGLGTSFNKGEKYLSCIYLKELVRIVDFIRIKKEITGIVNITQPEFVTFDGFFNQLAGTIGKPMIFTVPDFLIRLVFGKASVALLSSHRVLPKKLLDHGYVFQYDSLENILKEICHKSM